MKTRKFPLEIEESCHLWQRSSCSLMIFELRLPKNITCAKESVKYRFLPLGEISERGIAIIVVVRPSVDKIFGADF